MLSFWDSSALVPLIISQQKTTFCLKHWKASAANSLVWWTTQIECFSALSRLKREEEISGEEFEQAEVRLIQLLKACHEVQPSQLLKDKALRALKLHKLRAADAMQLAAALVAAEDLNSPINFICLDKRLAESAKLEGLKVLTE